MKEKKRNSLVKYDPSSDVLYIATREGVEEEFTEVAPGVNVELERTPRSRRLSISSARRSNQWS